MRKLIWLLDINADLSLFIFSVSGRFIQSFFLVQNCYLSEGALLLYARCASPLVIGAHSLCTQRAIALAKSESQNLESTKKSYGLTRCRKNMHSIHYIDRWESGFV